MKHTITLLTGLLTLATLGLTCDGAVTFYIADQSGWETASGGAANIETITTSASGIALADEVTLAPSNGDSMSTIQMEMGL